MTRTVTVRGMMVIVCVLTLAVCGFLQRRRCSRGEGRLPHPTPAVQPLTEIELRGENEHVALDDSYFNGSIAALEFRTTYPVDASR